MKKIGILTFHYADNYGAVIQAWALRNVLNTLPDCRADIIHYVPKGYEIYPYKNTPEHKTNMCKKREKYEKFLMDYCGIDTPMIHDLASTDYEYYCVGSDQVWNLSFRENADMQYLLPDLKEDALRFSYAASIGGNFSKENEQVFQKYLPRFDYISVRESQLVEPLGQISGKEVAHVLDPSLLIEANMYDGLIEQKKYVEGKFIFFFWYPCGEDPIQPISVVNKLARKYDCKVIHTLLDVPKHTFVEDGGTVFYCGIQEFLWYIKNAEVVVTNSFHGAALSIQLEKPFYLAGPNTKNVRIKELTNMFGLEDTILRGYVSSDKLTKERDFTGAKELVAVEREKSMNYLKKVLNIS